MYFAALLRRFPATLHQTRRVGVEIDGRVGQLHAQCVPVTLDDGAGDLDRLLRDVAQIHASLLQPELSRRDAADVQQILDQR